MVISADRKGTLDQPTLNLLKEVKSEVPIVQINSFSGYEFDEKLYELDQWILADFLEYGANSPRQNCTHLWGVNSHLFSQANTEEWVKFDKFVKDRKPLVYFKRELQKKDVGGSVFPIDFPAFFSTPPVQSKAEFESRPIQAILIWGHSHESRRATHGNIFLNSTKKGYGVIDSFYHFERGLSEYKNVWATIQTPHYARLPMQDVLFVQGHSKISLSLRGAGDKCFRMCEAPLNSIMLMEEDGLAYAHPWVHGENCIKVPYTEDFEEIRGVKNSWRIIEAVESALERDDLYSIYLKGVENCGRYRVDRYCKEYLEPIIKQQWGQ